MPKKLSRKELYQMVWDRPMIQVASDFEISDVGLRKICTKHKIPVPDRGYWAKRAAGKTVRKLALLKTKDSSLNEIRIDGAAYKKSGPAVERVVKESKQNATMFQKAVLNAQTVDEEHPIASRTRKQLERSSLNQFGLKISSGPKAADCHASPGCVERVCAILNVLLHAAEGLGYQAKFNEKRMVIVVNNEDIPFSIKERVKKIPHVKTKAEMARLDKWENERSKKTYEWSVSFDSSPYIPEWDFLPTGKLTFQFDDSHYDGIRRKFADGKTRKVEDLLDKILSGFEVCAVAARTRREKIEAREREWREEALKKKELRKLQALEEKRIIALTRDLADWKKANEIREYADLIKAQYFRDGKMDHEIEEWASWTLSYADQIDPVKRKVPNLLQFLDYNS
jgi:hypothetical protein